MSWQEYVDSNLIGTGNLKSAAIYGLDGHLWASTPDLQSDSTFDPKLLIKSFSDPKDLQINGITVNGTRYVMLRSDDRSIYGKSKGNGGFVGVKTEQAVLFGLYPDDVTPGNANKTVESLADYLISAGY